jgi:hypothetical protein
MKKSYLLFFMLFSFAFAMHAQETISQNAIGMRFGNNYGFEVEISYQRKLSPKNRLELDLGWSNSDNTAALKATGSYQWYWNLEKGLYWYAGCGGGFGTWNTNDNYANEYAEDSGVFVAAIGDIGIEYHFKEIPIQLSIDAKPEFIFNNYKKNDFGVSVGLGIRYKF